MALGPLSDEGAQVIGSDAARVDDPDVRPDAALAQAVHGGGIHVEVLRDVGHAEEATATAVRHRDTGRNNVTCWWPPS
jgi:hypothetical protein